MEFNGPQMAATAAIIALVLFLLKKTSLFEGTSIGKRMLITVIAPFVPIFILNLIRPYSAG